MPGRPFLPRPGINTQTTPLMTGEGFVDSNLVRFKDGLLQKRGGSSRLSSQMSIGTCRGLRPFYDLQGNSYIGIGTTDRLELLNNAAITDITPIRSTTNIVAPFSTAAGSSTVTVADTPLVTVGDWVSIANATFAGGLLLQGIYPVIGTTGGSYTINVGLPATVTAFTAGAVVVFATTTGSHVVGVSIAGYTFTTGQTLTVAVSTTVGGLTFFGPYLVSVTGGVATIQHPNAAASTTSGAENSGAVRLNYLIQTAQEQQNIGTGPFGQATYGTGPYGVSASTSPFGGWLRQWSLEAWGQDLIASPTDGAVYVWTPPIATANPAVLIATAPAKSTAVIVTTPSRQVMCFACTDPNTGLQDPLLIRFSDVDDFTDFTASATNQAGSFRLSSGQRIVGGLSIAGQVLIWTDADLWSAQYLGFPLVWGFNKVGRNCGLRCQRGIVTLDKTYWIGPNGFWTFDGQSVEPLRSSVWDFVFENIDNTYPGAAFMGANSFFNEFTLYFPTVGSNGVANAYVNYNTLDGVWDKGFLSRSAWADTYQAGQPIAADYTGLVQTHETGNDLDGAIMDSWALTGLMALGEGDAFTCLKRLRVDFVVLGNEQITITVFISDYADGGTPPRVYGPYQVTATTKYLYVGARGRYMSMKIESNSHGIFWRLGKIDGVVTPDGRQG